MATGENLFSMQDGGHQMSLAIAAGLGLAAMSATPISSRPTAGFPDGVKVQNGYVTLPPLVGIGFEGKADLIAEMRSPAS
jgi:D(-)-tartrate dehydratase